MEVAFDAQLLYESQKTGIAKSAEYILYNLEQKNNASYYLNIKEDRKRILKNASLDRLYKIGYKEQICPWYLNSIDSRIPGRYGIPYCAMFSKKVDVTMFFNYLVPQGVRGKVVTMIHDMAYKTYPDTVESVTRSNLEKNMSHIVKRADVIITISNFSKKELIKYFPNAAEKIKVVYLGIDPTIFHSNYKDDYIEQVKRKYQIKKKYILYIGTLEPRKNIKRLIEAYAKLAFLYPQSPDLVVAGRKGWLYEDIFAKVKELAIEERVIFTGYIKDEEIPVLLNGAELFAFPSLYEGFGIPPLEAMACGTPVMISNIDSLLEVVGDAGICVDPYDINTIFKGLRYIVENKEEKQRLIVAGQLRAKEFTWEYTTESISTILEQLI